MPSQPRSHTDNPLETDHLVMENSRLENCRGKLLLFLTLDGKWICPALVLSYDPTSRNLFIPCVMSNNQLLEAERIDSDIAREAMQHALKMDNVQLWQAMTDEFNWPDPADLDMRHRSNELRRQKSFAVCPPATEPMVHGRSPNEICKYGRCDFRDVPHLQSANQ